LTKEQWRKAEILSAGGRPGGSGYAKPKNSGLCGSSEQLATLHFLLSFLRDRVYTSDPSKLDHGWFNPSEILEHV
jgi:hypothetical protein